MGTADKAVGFMRWKSPTVNYPVRTVTLDTDFCVEAVVEAISRYGMPEIFNTDQGAQFTAGAFTYLRKSHRVSISTDGRGRVQDNIFIERLWYTLKYQYLYLWSFDNGAELWKGLEQFVHFYYAERSHQSLDNLTPDEVYFGLLYPLAQAAWGLLK